MEQNKLFNQITTYENLYLAYEKARKRKTLKKYVIDFEKNLKQNILDLQSELISNTYKPKPLETFILRDPKTRKISKSDFRDRVIHHALCNVIEPMFDKKFIYDNYANKIKKGTLKAVERFDNFKKKISKNYSRNSYILKTDVKHYFETIDHEILISLIKRTIKDSKVMWLIETILANHSEGGGATAKIGMPLGNLTSQFFANVYLNELDQFVKHEINIEYYIRYVDDFVILHDSKNILEQYQIKINEFIKAKLNLELHPDKTKIIKLSTGVNFLGFRIFPEFRLIRKKNLKKFDRRFNKLKKQYEEGAVDREKVIEIFEGWIAYISHADTYKYRRHITKRFNQYFPIESNTEIKNPKKHQNFINKIEESDYIFTTQKTLQLLKKGLSIEKIAQQRKIKESTVWQHIANLIEYNQINIWRVLPKNKIHRILSNIHSENDKLKEIKERIKDNSITFDEISGVLASVKYENKKKNILRNVSWYKKNHCFRKCFYNIEQREKCSKKFDSLISKNPTMEISRKEFLDLFNNHLNICVLPENEKLRYVSWKEFVMKNKIKIK